MPKIEANNDFSFRLDGESYQRGSYEFEWALYNVGIRTPGGGDSDYLQSPRPLNEWTDNTDTPFTADAAGKAAFIAYTDAFFFRSSVGGGGSIPLIPDNQRVDNFALLPTPAIDFDGQYWIVDNATGIQFINRRPAGIYKSVGGVWAYRGPDIPSYFVDNVLRFSDNVSGLTLEFILDLLSTNRQVTWPDDSFTIGKASDDTGPVTIHSDVNSSGSGEIITTQERTDINASIGVHSDVDLSGVIGTLDNYVLKWDFSQLAFIPCLHQLVRSSALLINNTNVLVDKINVQINVQRLNPHKLTVTYNWSLNDAAQDFVAVASFGGQNLMVALTDNTEIHRQEPKDVGGGDPDGRGTNQRHSYSKTFIVTPLATGNNALILQFSGSANGDLASMWEATIEIEELISITGS